MKIIDQIQGIGIIPVIKVQTAEDALCLAEALYKGGIDVLEITFSSDIAKNAIELIHNKLPEMLAGAGGIQSPEQAEAAVSAGAGFITTPGLNSKVIEWCMKHDALIFPGISTASELESALSYGVSDVKFFPAQSSGGAAKLMDLSASYPHVRFLPAGGIDMNNMHDYLSMPGILAVCGSFMLPDEAVDARDWDEITRLSKDAVKTMLAYELIHIGMNSNDAQEAEKNARLLCHLFDFTFYKKPKSYFAGKGFEVLNGCGKGKLGHIGIYTPDPQRALYHLQKKGIQAIEDSITRNKKTNLINFAYLDIEIAGFGIHLINPDVKM